MSLTSQRKQCRLCQLTRLKFNQLIGQVLFISVWEALGKVWVGNQQQLMRKSNLGIIDKVSFFVIAGNIAQTDMTCPITNRAKLQTKNRLELTQYYQDLEYDQWTSHTFFAIICKENGKFWLDTWLLKGFLKKFHDSWSVKARIAMKFADGTAVLIILKATPGVKPFDFVSGCLATEKRAKACLDPWNKPV